MPGLPRTHVSTIDEGRILSDIMQLTGNTLLITGGTSGIGRALAEQFHRLGNTVIIAGRRQALLDEITAQHPGMHGIPLDVADPRAIDAFAARMREQFPTLNVVFNNAGISRSEDLTTDTLAVARSLIETNILSVLHLTSALLPLLRKQAHATLLATTSGLAFVPRSDYPTYCATKAFLHSWLQSLRYQLRKTTVEVIELIPPYVQTELTGPAQAADPRAVPLAKYIGDVMRILADGGTEILVEESRAGRWAASAENYDAQFATRNPRTS